MNVPLFFEGDVENPTKEFFIANFENNGKLPSSLLNRYFLQPS